MASQFFDQFSSAAHGSNSGPVCPASRSSPRPFFSQLQTEKGREQSRFAQGPWPGNLDERRSRNAGLFSCSSYTLFGGMPQSSHWELLWLPTLELWHPFSLWNVNDFLQGHVLVNEAGVLSSYVPIVLFCFSPRFWSWNWSCKERRASRRHALHAAELAAGSCCWVRTIQ